MTTRTNESIDMTDRIELRRFVGREHLLWIWFETEVFDATLATKKHGTFGMWVESRLVISDGKESTTIKGTMPGHHREAKESLRRGKLPEKAGLHMSFGDHEVRLTLDAESLAIAGLAPITDKKAAKPEVEGSEAAHESFYARMHLARDVESILEALYRDFLTLRLGDAWSKVIVPAIEAWTAGRPVDAEAYRAARDAALGERTRAKLTRAKAGVQKKSRRAAREDASDDLEEVAQHG